MLFLRPYIASSSNCDDGGKGSTKNDDGRRISDDDDDDDNGNDDDDDDGDDDDDSDDDDDKTKTATLKSKPYKGPSHKQNVICKTSSFQSVTTPKSLTKTLQRQESKAKSSNKQRPSKTMFMTKRIKRTASDEQKMSSTPSSAITRTITVTPRQPIIFSDHVYSHSISFYSISPTTTSSLLPKLNTSTSIQNPDGTKMSVDMLFLTTPPPTSVLMTSISSTVTLLLKSSAVLIPTTPKQSEGNKPFSAVKTIRDVYSDTPSFTVNFLSAFSNRGTIQFFVNASENNVVQNYPHP